MINKILKGSNLFIFYYGLISVFLLSCESQNDVSQIPVIELINPITEITATSALSGGSILSDNGYPILAKGLCWSTSNNPTINDSKTDMGAGEGVFICTIFNLKSNTKYYVRAYATNSYGTSYSKTIPFFTYSLPSIISTTIQKVTNVSVEINSDISNPYRQIIISSGVCWSTTPNPSIELETKITSSLNSHDLDIELDNLQPATTYYLRSFVTTNSGTSYGLEITFSTLGGKSDGSFTDIDGNVYQSIIIGDQTWMQANLRTTRYRNGDSISTTFNSNQDISSEPKPAYHWAYNGDEANIPVFGRLYTWYAATDIRNIAPTGWHIPSDAEFATLQKYLHNNGYNYKDPTRGDYTAKSVASKTLWQYSMKEGNIGFEQIKNNYSGFNAFPAGKRNLNGSYDYLNYSTIFWTSTKDKAVTSWARQLCANYSDIYRCSPENGLGLSIRCIKD